MASFDEGVQAFWAKVARCQHRGACRKCCWAWQGSLTPSGHGILAWYGRSTGAHRLALELTHGALIFGGRRVVVLHRCDYPPCCNPQHLLLGTAWDNAQDRVRRRRHFQGKAFMLSVRRPLGRYTELGVFLRLERVKRVLTLHDFAKLLGLSVEQVHRLEQGGYRPQTFAGIAQHIASALGMAHVPQEALPKRERGHWQQEFDVCALVDPLLQDIVGQARSPLCP